MERLMYYEYEKTLDDVKRRIKKYKFKYTNKEKVELFKERLKEVSVDNKLVHKDSIKRLVKNGFTPKCRYSNICRKKECKLNKSSGSIYNFGRCFLKNNPDFPYEYISGICSCGEIVMFWEYSKYTPRWSQTGSVRCSFCIESHD